MTNMPNAVDQTPGVAALADMTPREIVAALEMDMKTLPQIALPVKHYFSPGVYARELFIPAGTLLTGKIHKHEHLCIMSMGDMSVLLEDGVIHRVQAPFTTIAPPGTKRIAYAHADTLWTTIHATEETDINRIEAQLVVETEAEYADFVKALRKDNVKCLS